MRTSEGGTDCATGTSRVMPHTRTTLVHGSGIGYQMKTKRPLPEVPTDEVSEAQPVQVCEVSVSGAELA
jgi:hypothetical protein